MDSVRDNENAAQRIQANSDEPILVGITIIVNRDGVGIEEDRFSVRGRHSVLGEITSGSARIPYNVHSRNGVEGERTAFEQ